ncbi:MAG: UTP--glucose-1-phosphate uridylyltransferase [bacterium]|nr:UTP--glucose-1-phosphate uridylyltransferase [bacterium]
MGSKKKIRKAIIPAAGYGTRFLPATKAQPKEMLPVVDKPIIQYVVEDAVSAGIEDVIIVTGWFKKNIEDHFDYPFELEHRLEQAGKIQELEEIRRIADMANFTFIRQKGPLGNATPIWNARHLIGDEPFMVLWADDFMEASPTRAQQLVQAYEKYGGCAIVSSMRAGRDEDYKLYGYAAGSELSPGVLEINKIIEKPGPDKIDSDYALIGGSVYEPIMFDAIEEATRRHKSKKSLDEIVYIDAINILLEQKKTCYALEIKNSKYYDCGNKLDYLKAVVEFGLKHDDLRDDFTKFLKNMKF